MCTAALVLLGPIYQTNLNIVNAIISLRLLKQHLIEWDEIIQAC